MTDDYTSIPVPGLPSLTEVRLYAETLDHIAEHPEFRLQLPSQRTGLEIAIANPSAIHDSTTAPGKSVALVSDAFTYLGDPVHVPVRIVEGTSGRVQTAYFSSSAPPGTLLWSAGDA
jgi:hypothetical protein